ncbi:MAG: hypothetical protein ACM3SP_07980, partial [Chloroflexota bacterium]
VSTEVIMNNSRRSFLKSSALGFIALGLPPSFLVRAAGAQQNGSHQETRRQAEGDKTEGGGFEKTSARAIHDYLR